MSILIRLITIALLLLACCAAILQAQSPYLLPFTKVSNQKIPIFLVTDEIPVLPLGPQGYFLVSDTILAAQQNGGSVALSRIVGVNVYPDTLIYQTSRPDTLTDRSMRRRHFLGKQDLVPHNRARWVRLHADNYEVILLAKTSGRAQILEHWKEKKLVLIRSSDFKCTDCRVPSSLAGNTYPQSGLSVPPPSHYYLSSAGLRQKAWQRYFWPLQWSQQYALPIPVPDWPEGQWQQHLDNVSQQELRTAALLGSAAYECSRKLQGRQLDMQQQYKASTLIEQLFSQQMPIAYRCQQYQRLLRRSNASWESAAQLLAQTAPNAIRPVDLAPWLDLYFQEMPPTFRSPQADRAARRSRKNMLRLASKILSKGQFDDPQFLRQIAVTNRSQADSLLQADVLYTFFADILQAYRNGIQDQQELSMDMQTLQSSWQFQRLSVHPEYIARPDAGRLPLLFEIAENDSQIPALTGQFWIPVFDAAGRAAGMVRNRQEPPPAASYLPQRVPSDRLTWSEIKVWLEATGYLEKVMSD